MTSAGLKHDKVFTKFHLRTAYNLICIRADNEWKTAFSTTSGHYHYQVMPYGLATAPSVFQNMINEVLRELLHKFVIAYIEDILICSPDLSSHIGQILHLGQYIQVHYAHLSSSKRSIGGHPCLEKLMTTLLHAPHVLKLKCPDISL